MDVGVKGSANLGRSVSIHAVQEYTGIPAVALELSGAPDSNSCSQSMYIVHGIL